MKIRVAVLLAVVALSGCTKTVEEMNYTERKALGAELVKRCMGQGIDPKSPEMNKCTYAEAQSEIASRRRKAAVEDARRSSSSGPNMCQDFGGNMVCF